MLKKLTHYTLAFTIIALVAAGGFLYYRYQQAHPSTDDAYLKANVVHISTQITGPISEVDVYNHQLVKKGQTLFIIDPTPFTMALDKAEANLAKANHQLRAMDTAITAATALITQRQAELANTQKTTDRTLTLLKRKLTPAAKGDQAKRNLIVAKAALKNAHSQLQEAKQKRAAAVANIQALKDNVKKAALDLAHTRIIAPASGHLVKFKLRIGDTVTAYQPLFSLIETDHWWVKANFKETDLNHIHPGQHATITLDMYPNHPFQGTVKSISNGSGASFSLLPPENASGNWVKVTQRFPVRIQLQSPDGKPLRMGSSCTVTINTTA